jgi:hypothetical protein
MSQNSNLNPKLNEFKPKQPKFKHKQLKFKPKFKPKLKHKFKPKQPKLKLKFKSKIKPKSYQIKKIKNHLTVMWQSAAAGSGARSGGRRCGDCLRVDVEGGNSVF